MTTPETLLDRTILLYESSYSLHYRATNVDTFKKMCLIDSITWVNKKLFDMCLLSKEEYNTILAMISSEDKENVAVAEAIIRNLKFEL